MISCSLSGTEERSWTRVVGEKIAWRVRWINKTGACWGLADGYRRRRGNSGAGHDGSNKRSRKVRCAVEDSPGSGQGSIKKPSAKSGTGGLWIVGQETNCQWSTLPPRHGLSRIGLVSVGAQNGHTSGVKARRRMIGRDPRVRD